MVDVFTSSKLSSGCIFVHCSAWYWHFGLHFIDLIWLHRCRWDASDFSFCQLSFVGYYFQPGGGDDQLWVTAPSATLVCLKTAVCVLSKHRNQRYWEKWKTSEIFKEKGFFRKVFFPLGWSQLRITPTPQMNASWNREVWITVFISTQIFIPSA